MARGPEGNDLPAGSSDGHHQDATLAEESMIRPQEALGWRFKAKRMVYLQRHASNSIVTPFFYAGIMGDWNGGFILSSKVDF